MRDLWGIARASKLIAPRWRNVSKRDEDFDTAYYIGPHKTCTSYLQKTLFDHRPQVVAQGVAYPDAGMEFEWGHHALAAALQRENWAQAEGYLDAALASPMDVLLSSEDFDRLPTAVLARWGALLAERDVQVAFIGRYLRLRDTDRKQPGAGPACASVAFWVRSPREPLNKSGRSRLASEMCRFKA
jgi:hypothetical protein